MQLQGLSPSFACVHAQSCLTLCNPMDCSPSGSFFFFFGTTLKLEILHLISVQILLIVNLVSWLLMGYLVILISNDHYCEFRL